MVNGDFRGVHPRAWVAASALLKFIEDLEELDRTRSGEATLQSMSPGEFDLTIRTADALGHLLVTASVAHARYVGSKPIRIRDSAAISFELDSSLLGDTVSSFRGLSADIA
jgi:hypothetical protein